jgi:acyl-CoA synthetase (AMP-forming)/AMP-acid ligase II
MTGNLYHLIAATVQRNPSAVAIQTDSGEVFNYAEFDRWTACYSAFLAARNVRRGDRVLLQADKSAHLLLLTYACIRAGIIAVPINVGSRNLEVATLVSDSEPTLVICDPRRKAIYDSLSKHSRTNFQLSTLAANGRGEAREWAENLGRVTVSRRVRWSNCRTNVHIRYYRQAKSSHRDTSQYPG